MTDVEVRVNGLRELGAAFKRVDKEYGKELQRGLKVIAEQIAGRVRSVTPGTSGGLVKARATQRGASIVVPGGEGTERGDQYPWLDFGGSTGKGHKIGSAWSGSVKRDNPPGGRYLYPTIAAHGDAIEDQVGDLLLSLARRVGFTTHGT